MATDTLNQLARYVILAGLLVGLGSSVAAQTVPPKSNNLRFADCPPDAKEMAQCDLTSYIVRVVIAVVLPLVVGIVAWVVCPFFWCFRCCGMCGGMRQSTGFCCGDSSGHVLYTRGAVLRAKILYGWAFAIGAAGLGLGVSGNMDLSAAFDGFLDDIKQAPSILNGVVTKITVASVLILFNPLTLRFDRISPLEPGGQFQDIRTTARSIVAEVESNLDDGTSMIRSYLPIVTQAIFGVVAAPMFLVLISSLCCLANVRTFFPHFISCLLWFFMLPIWLIHGVVSALATILGEFCAEVQSAAERRDNVFVVVAKCSDSTFAGFKERYTSFRDLYTSSACSTILAPSVCYSTAMSASGNAGIQRVYDCPSAVISGSCPPTISGIRDLLSNTLVTHNSIASLGNAVSSGYTCGTTASTACTVAKCAEECRNGGAYSAVGARAQFIMSSMEAAGNITSVADTLVSDFASCAGSFQFISQPLVGSCNKMAASLDNLQIGTGLCGLACILGIITLIFGSKRFISMDRTHGTVPVVPTWLAMSMKNPGQPVQGQQVGAEGQNGGSMPDADDVLYGLRAMDGF